MFTIERGSEAFRTLEAMVTNPDTRYIRVTVREHGDQPTEVCLSQNQGMWTPPLGIQS